MLVDLTRDLTAADAAARLKAQGFVTLTPSALAAQCGLTPVALPALNGEWDRLAPDTHLKDGGRYRHRRHGCLVQDLGDDGTTRRLRDTPHRAHWQPTTYNALHGGLTRWFEPLSGAMAQSAAWRGLVAHLGELFAQVRRPAQGRWFIEAHPFRIDTADGVGRPTPEGAHRDGVDFVAVMLVSRQSIIGGETRVFDADGPQGVRFTLDRPWSALLIDDERVIHESTPIQRDPAAPEVPGVRDTLVLTYRQHGFQAPADEVPPVLD